MKPVNLAILIGHGSRLPAILKGLEHYPYINIVTIISHKRESLGIDFAESKEITSFYFRITDWYKQKTGLPISQILESAKKWHRHSYMRELAKILKNREVDFILMSGWDILLTKELIDEFPDRIINVHPSLLPAFPGENAWIQALEYGVKFTGITIHLVTNEGMDNGPILAQETVKITNDETAETLRKKLNEIEDELTAIVLVNFVKEKLKLLNKKIK